MTFLHGALAAAGFACIAIPIIIHFLFRRRRRPIRWGAMRFLMEAVRKQSRRLRLEQFLLLAARCLVIACVAAALGRPLLERAGILGAGAGRTVYVLIDNGLASSIRLSPDGPTALERHQRTAIEQVEALGPGDRAGLVLLAGPASPLIVPASADLQAVVRQIKEAAPADSRTDIAGAIEALGARLRDADAGPRGVETRLLVLSDFLDGSADITRPLPSSLAGIEGVRVAASRTAESSPGNTQVLSVEPLHSVMLTGASGNAADAPVRIALRRSGPASAPASVTMLRLSVVGDDGRPMRPPVTTPVRWQPGQSEQSTTVQLDLTAGAAGVGRPGGDALAALVAEIDRDAIEGDDAFRRPIDVREALRVGVVAQRRFGRGPRVDRLSAGDWIRLALAPGAAASVEVIDIEPSSLDTPLLSATDAIVLPSPDLLPADAWGRLRRFVDGGGLLVIVPPSDATVNLWPDELEKAFELGWRIAREPEMHVETPLKLDDQDLRSPLLATLSFELPQLLRPVGMMRLLPLENVPPGTQTVLKLRDGRAWMIAGAPGSGSAEAGRGAESAPASRQQRGLVVYMASAPVLSWTDLPARPLMVPLVQELVRQGVGTAMGSPSVVAGEQAQAPSRGGSVMELRPLGATESASRVPVDPSGLARLPLRRAGLFRAVDEAGRSVGMLAVNADTDAGRATVQSAGDVQAWLGGALGLSGVDAARSVSWIEGDGAGAASMAAAGGGSTISLPLLVAALVLALLETGMARWFSHARREGPGPGPALAAA